MLVYMIVHDRVHNSPPPVPNLSQINPFHAHPSYLNKPSNISLPPTAVFQEVSFLQVTPPNLYMYVTSPHTCHMPRPSISSLFNHLTLSEVHVSWNSLICHNINTFFYFSVLKHSFAYDFFSENVKSQSHRVSG